MIQVGCHLSSQGGFLSMGKRAENLGADTFAFFTRNPRGGGASPVDPEDAAALNRLLRENGFGKIVAHASYTMNVCSEKEHIREYARTILKEDLQRMEAIPGNYYNFHPGSHVGQGEDTAIPMIADALNNAMFPEQSTTVLLETMAGKGSEVGKTFEDLRSILDRTEMPEKIGVCMDTCHISDAGYDIIGNLDQVLAEFDRVLGLDRLKAVHINDSMNLPGSRKDRHAKIGQGCIGMEALKAFATHPLLQNRPFILETPNDENGYREEIRLIRSWF